MDKFNVGDMIKRTNYGTGGIFMGNNYEVVAVDGVWLTVFSDNGNEHECLSCNFEIVVTNEIQVGETYTSHNGKSWVAIYEEGDFVWMKHSDVVAAFVFKKDGTAVSFDWVTGYSINWEATKGPIIEEGVVVYGGDSLYIHNSRESEVTHSYKITVTTVDGVPDWTTLACKEPKA
jgi:hypothetical protein